ncbi:Hypothetical predicted protein [Mytilus galloprovincialis]|uniref:CUB domain-containing protein n=1 Tax=Mytilus galloprovincialis TaxID=29158 RepID=A0A8B6FS45_MYTGA|nr:Hypothetical predicted protein [Mytilus galloprovincialis]
MKTNMEKFYSVISLLFFIVEVSSITKYDLKSVCDGPSQLLTIPTDGDILLTHSSSDPLLPNMTCVVSIYNPMTKYPGRVLAYFESFSTDESKNCVNSRLDIYDERGTSVDKALTGPNGVCGNRDNLDIYYNSTQQYMTFRFKDVNRTSNFRVVLTAAHTGICQKSEFGCGNGFCIGQHLECNGYNNCGNDIDELACVVALAAGIIVVIIIGSILAIICFVTAIMCLVCRPRRRNIYTRI